MRVLLVGSGGREHALAWKLAQSPALEWLRVAPGNAGTGTLGERVANLPIGADDVEGLVNFSAENQVDLVVVGPEAPLELGLVDRLAERDIPAVGPSAAAALIESQKSFAKAFMERHGIPTARYGSFTDLDAAIDFVRAFEGQVVVKASGLAAGKGVMVTGDAAEAEAALRLIMTSQIFGAAGAEVVVEERLSGPELSVLAFSDGETVAVMPPAQDYKRALDGDAGPNTGGMGAVAPAPPATPALLELVQREVLEPTLRGMRAEGRPYVGVLYAGIMLTAAGPKVLEFNCRFGDPETQVLMPLLEGDLAEIMLACVHGRLADAHIHWSVGAAATVVLASEGYPGTYAKGRPIRGLDAAGALDGVIVFHAGTALHGDEIVTAGGRVLAVTAVGIGLDEARRRAYAGVGEIEFEGMQYRSDIARVWGE